MTVEVKKVEDLGAYVTLLEFGEIEGMVPLSELSRRRIRWGGSGRAVAACGGSGGGGGGGVCFVVMMTITMPMLLLLR